MLSYQIAFQYVILKNLNYNDYGTYSSAQLFSSYIVFFTLGLQTNLSVKISREKDLRMPEDEINATFTYFILIILLGAIFHIIYDFIYFNSIRKEVILITFLSSFKAILIQKFLNVLLRSSKQITYLSIIQIIVSCILYIFLFFFQNLGLLNVLILFSIECFFSFMLLFNKRDIPAELNFSSIKKILTDGFQFWKVNSLFLFFPIIVSTLALTKFSTEDFGKFSLFYVSVNMFAKITSSVEKLNYIEISKSFPDIRRVHPVQIFKKNIFYFALGCLLCFIGFALMGKDLLVFFLPNHVPSFSILLLSILAAIVSLFNYLNVYYDVAEKLSLKYINVVIKILSFLILYSFFNFFGILDVLSLCFLIIISELIALLVNIIVLKSTIFK